MKLTLTLLTLCFATAGFSQTFTEVLKSVASDRAESDRYGYDVDMHGDYAAIGAYGKDFVENEGQVYIWERTGINNWVETQILTNSDQESYDRFGYALAIHNDLLVVGAYGEDEDETGSNSMAKAGSAYIFERDAGGTWNEVQKIVASDRTAGDEFGWSVAIYDSTIVIGAHTEEEDEAGLNNIYHAGSVYVFDRDGAGVWNETQKIVPNERAADINFPSGGSAEDLSDLFGGSVAIWGDWMVVGSHHHDWGPGFTAAMWSSGAAYIFERDAGGVWNEITMIQNFDREPWDRFGFDVAIDTNVIAVCSYSEDEEEDGVTGSTTNAGSVHLFERDAGGTWTQSDKIVPDDRDAGDHFGYSLDLHGDYVVLGCHSDNNDEFDADYLEDAGSAYIFERVAPGDWEQFQKIDASDRREYDDHGIAVAIWDYTVMVGAQYQDWNEVDLDSVDEAGAVYIYSNVLCEDTSVTTTPIICEGQTHVVGISTYTASGLYTDVMVKTDGCDSIVNTNLTVIPAPTGSQDVSICFGTSYTYGGSTYTTTGIYIDTISAGGGCDSIVTTNLTVEPENAVTQDVMICWGESYTIGASTYTTAGTYVDVLTSSSFCDSTVTTNLTVQLPVDVSITQADNYLTANQAGATYQWYNCDTESIIIGATGQSWWAFDLGNFACIIDFNGCIDTSACVYVATIGTIEFPMENFISIYPNPSSGKFTMEVIGMDLGKLSYTITNSLGEVILSNGFNSKEEIDISNQASGVYHLQISGELGTLTKQIVIE